MTNECTPIPILHMATMAKFVYNMGVPGQILGNGTCTNSKYPLNHLKRSMQQPKYTQCVCTVHTPRLLPPPRCLLGYRRGNSAKPKHGIRPLSALHGLQFWQCKIN